MKCKQIVFLLTPLMAIAAPVLTQAQNKFQPTLASLEKSNPVPEWFQDAKFGIYFHWGVYSVPAFANEWYPRNMYIKNTNENKHHMNAYGTISEWPFHNFITGAKDKQGNFVQFAPKLKSQGGKFDPEEWAQLFYDAGAKYAGPVAEHHDGFSMWASKVNPWNAKDMGPKLDLVGLLTDAIREKNMRVILSMHHAFNITGFYSDVPKTNDSKLQMLYGQQGNEKNESLWLAKHKEIIDNYRPDIIWQDFNLHRISQPVLLGFLSYYYNKAAAWQKQVVATYKDGLNTRIGVLDYERGGPTDVTEDYWLTDDAISNSSWCYTEGIGYYSQKQVLHGFLDRISKNGNLLLNISPKADGSIPQEQKDILLAMGAWLKKYGEAVYATRAWEKYGEGPIKMGAAHGVFQAPAEGTAKDVRFTRSKDNTTLYAILLGWEKGQKEIVLTSLTSDRIKLQHLKSVQLINNGAGKYLPLTFKQTREGLTVVLPERSFEDQAYVLKLSFSGKIPPLDQYVDMDTAPHYYLLPGSRNDSLTLSASLTLAKKKNEAVTQWKLQSPGKGFYKILSRGNNKVLTLKEGNSIAVSDYSGTDRQLWKIEQAFGLFRISNKQDPSFVLSVNGTAENSRVAASKLSTGNPVPLWRLQEVCELRMQAFKNHNVPGIVEAEDFNRGCPGEAYFDRDEENSGSEYRLTEAVDIEKCAAGGYNVGWIRNGEWLTYTINVTKSGTYLVSFYVASTIDDGRVRLEFDGANPTTSVAIPNTGGTQNWTAVKQSLRLDEGEHTLKIIFTAPGSSVNIDKMVFEEVR